MKSLIINAVAICLFALMSIGSFAQSQEEMKALVAKMNQEMMDMVKAGRYEAMGKYYDEEAVSLPNYRAMEKGYKLILNNNLGRKQGGYKILDGQKTTTVFFLGQDMMVDIGTYTLTMDFPGLPQPKVDNGKYMNVWRKDAAGAWRIIAETWNADKSPNAPPQSKAQTSSGMGGATIKSNPGTGTETGTEQKPVETKDGKK